MSQTIHRMYDRPATAIKAAQALNSNRFVRYTYVYVFSRTTDDGTELSADAIVAELMKAHVLKANARILADSIQRGGTVVTVHAPFGTAVDAIQILDSFGPTDSGVPDFKEDFTPWDEAAPCSSVLGWRVLLPDSATFSRFWNVPALSKKSTTTSSKLGMRELSDSSGPFTGTFGMPLISNKPTIFSSMLGMPVLKKSRAGRGA